MKRLNVFCSLFTGVAFALSPGTTIAQQTSLKEQLVGAWTLISCDRTTVSGPKQPYCVNPRGILIFDASGRYAHMIAAGGRPKLTTNNRTDIPAEQYKAAAQGVVANFGTWSVNEADRTITRHYDGALVPNFEGTDSKMSISIAGDELTLLAPNSAADLDHGRQFVTVYRRVK